MPSIYCPNCGSPNQYSFTKPSLCGSCNKSFNVFPVKQTTVASNPAPSIQIRTPETVIQKPKKRLRPRIEVEDEIDEPYLPGELEIPDVIHVPEEAEVIIHVARPESIKAGDVVKMGEGETTASIRKGPGRPKKNRASKNEAMNRLKEFSKNIYTREIHDES